MDEREITVADVSDGPDEGSPVSLPVLEVLTGRAFLTGKSGSGKSNTASVVAEKLLDEGFGLLVVDIEGEYYGLKEEYELLHAGADEECDIQVSEEHADKIASLALEQNVPIILDLSGFLHEQKARDLLTAVARALFAKEKKLKQPFLMIVEEIHEYVPEGGGMDECGKMLVKVAKRGRKHGLGVTGISQRPADVKKDFITQCDWLVWHRLTWQNDTRVVKRVLGEEYAEAIEDLDDGEAFLMTDWAEQVGRVQFRRKETFDAGATPGLDDFERPDLKSVSDDLVSELQTISEEQARREDEIGTLKRQLDEREQRIAELEEELAEARDLSRMAEQFAHAMTEQATVPARPPPQTELPDYADGPERRAESAVADENSIESAVADENGDGAAARSGGGVHQAVTPEQRAIIQDAVAAHGENGSGRGTDGDGGTVAAAEAGPTAGAGSAADEEVIAETAADGDGVATDAGAEAVTADADVAENGEEAGAFVATVDPGALAARLHEELQGLDDRAREMLGCYRDVGISTPEAVHEAAGGTGERADAYRHNRALRRRGFVVHVGRGRYAYALPSLLEAYAGGLDAAGRDELLATAEEPL